MKEKPIIFSTDMVRAILEGRKTQTRRVVKPQPPEGETVHGPQMYEPIEFDKHDNAYPGKPVFGAYSETWGVKCPYGKPGDRLWVRETWNGTKNTGFYYRADPGTCAGKWKPSIHMPRHACRMYLSIINVRIEPLQYITVGEAKAEGVKNLREFAKLWDTINAKRGYSWDMNPWVWVVEFRGM